MVAVGLLSWSQLGTVGNGCREPANGPPEPDDCGDPGSGAVIATLEIGPDGSGAFVPWQDGETVPITYGPQGGAMILLRIRATGTALADCMLQTTHISGDAGLSELGSNETALRWYDDPGGGRATRTAYVILDREPNLAEQVHVETTVLGVTAMRTLATSQ